MTDSDGKGRDHWIYLVFVVLSFLVYSRAFDNGFRQDDFVFLKHVETTAFLESLKPCTSFAFYRPGTIVLFRFIHMIFGRNAGAYIVFNFLTHLASSFLVLLILKRMRSFRGSAALAAGLFLLGLGHYGKTVMWACCCGQLVSIVLSLGGIFLSIRSCEGRKSRYDLFLAIFLMTAAVLFHEGAIVAPFVALLAVLFNTDSRRAPRRARVALLLIPVPLFLIIYRLFSSAYPEYGLHISLFYQVPGYLIRYAGFTVFPLQNTSIVNASPALQRLLDMAPQLHWMFGTLLLAAMGYLAVRPGKDVRTLSAWFPVAILPFTLIALPEDWLQLRYMYFASIPVCGLAAAGLHRLVSSRSVALKTIAAGFLALAVICTTILVLLLERHYAGF